MERITPQPDITLVGAGWLGLPLGKLLVETGYHVSGSTTREAGLPEIVAAGITPFLLNISSLATNSLAQAYIPKRVLVLNLPPKTDDDWKNGVINLCNQVHQAGASIIWVSSTGVYGRQAGEIIERSQLLPERSGGKVLAVLDQELLQSFKRITVLRPAGLVGPGRHPGRFLAGKSNLTGASEPVNLVHQADVVAFITLLIQQPAYGEVFNLCAPNHPSRAEFYSWATKVAGLLPPEFLEDEPPLTEKRFISGQKIAAHFHSGYLYPDPYQMPY